MVASKSRSSKRIISDGLVKVAAVWVTRSEDDEPEDGPVHAKRAAPQMISACAYPGRSDMR